MSWSNQAGEKKKYSVIFGVLFLIILITGCTTTSSPTPSNIPNSSPPTSTFATVTITTIIPEVPQVTLKPTLTTVQTPRAITSDDIKTHFMDLAFGVETSTISKNIPTVISTVTASNGDKELIEKFILEFNDLSQSGKISENLKEGENAELRIKFIPQGGMKDISSYDRMFKSNDIITAKILGNTIYINNNLNGDQRNHTILRSLYFNAGVKGDTLTYPDSVFYSEDNNNTKITPIDRKALEILFGGGLSNGMNVDDVKKVIYLK